MSQHGIVSQCVAVIDGRATVFNKVGEIVEIDDSVAASLGDAVYKIGGPYPKPKVTETSTDSVPEPSSDPGTTPEPTAESTPPSEKSKRRGADADRPS